MNIVKRGSIFSLLPIHMTRLEAVNYTLPDFILVTKIIELKTRQY